MRKKVRQIKPKVRVFLKEKGVANSNFLEPTPKQTSTIGRSIRMLFAKKSS